MMALAILSLLSSNLLAFLPNPGHPVIAYPDPGRVDCGTDFRMNQYTGDDGCEGEVLGRMGLMLMLGTGAVPISALGLLLMYRKEWDPWL